MPKAKKEETIIGYMDATDFEHELGHADGGNPVFPSIENLKKHMKCADECGIVEVEVKLIRYVQKRQSMATILENARKRKNK